ncbi:glycosyltransferase family 4 protein [archaeon]|nr:glycosyltransferase family 4 protein [archaeon]
MKIAFISDDVWPYNKGGKERRLYEITKRLAGDGHEVHIYCMNWWKGENLIQNEDGIYLHGVCRKYELYTKKGKRSIKQAILFSFALMKRLFDKKYELVDTDAFPYFPIISSWLVSKLKGERIITTWHEVWGRYWFEYLGWKGLFGYLTERICAKLTSEAVVVSELTKNRFKAISRAKTMLVPNGVDITKIKRIKPAKKRFDIIFAGRLIKEKNVDKLIEAVKGNYTLAIVGGGPEKARLMEQAKAYRNIKFLGKLASTEEVYAYMKSSNILAFPSSREGFGITVLEGLSCGCKVVSSNDKMNASIELIELGKNGYAVDLDKLDEGIIKAFSLRYKTNKDLMAKYDWSEIYKKYRGFILGGKDEK